MYPPLIPCFYIQYALLTTPLHMSYILHNKPIAPHGLSYGSMYHKAFPCPDTDQFPLHSHLLDRQSSQTNLPPQTPVRLPAGAISNKRSYPNPRQATCGDTLKQTFLPISPAGYLRGQTQTNLPSQSLVRLHTGAHSNKPSSANTVRIPAGILSNKPFSPNPRQAT